MTSPAADVAFSLQRLAITRRKRVRSYIFSFDGIDPVQFHSAESGHEDQGIAMIRSRRKADDVDFFKLRWY
jgi:hypothetical protein